MSAKIGVESPASARRQPLLTSSKKESGGRMGEAAGECAAVCCCFPCAMMHLMILAVFRLPRGLWRKRKRKRRSLLRKKRKNDSPEESDRRESEFRGGEEESTDSEECMGRNDVVEWDKEMWDRFYGAGFWRSASQRKDSD